VTKYLTPEQVANHFSVAAEKVREWCKGGEIVAIDVSRQPSKKPHYRISERAIQDFELQRSLGPVAKPKRRRRKLAIEQIV
jgi:hypothetical protein